MVESKLKAARQRIDLAQHCYPGSPAQIREVGIAVAQIVLYLEERHEAGRAPQVAPDVTSTDAMLDAAAMAPSGDAPDLDALQALCDAATPGPWSTDAAGEVRDEDDDVLCTTFGTVADGFFIAAARDALPKLIAEVRRLRTKLDNVFDDSPAEEFNHAF